MGLEVSLDPKSQVLLTVLVLEPGFLGVDWPCWGSAHNTAVAPTPKLSVKMVHRILHGSYIFLL